MKKELFSINYESLDGALNAKKYKLSDVKDRIEKVSFDIVRFKDGDKGADLWQIQSADDGDYIVSLYEEEKENVKTASEKTNWEVESNHGNLHFFYKGDPIFKAASSSLGLSDSDASVVSKTLPKKLANDQSFVRLLLKQVDSASKQRILTKYPELA
jgi:hypothetical protein